MSKVPGDFVNAEFVCHKLFALDWSSALRYEYTARLFSMPCQFHGIGTKNVVFKIRAVYSDLRVHILYWSSYFYSYRKNSPVQHM